MTHNHTKTIKRYDEELSDDERQSEISNLENGDMVQYNENEDNTISLEISKRNSKIDNQSFDNQTVNKSQITNRTNITKVTK